MTNEFKYVPVEPTDEMRIAWNTTESNSESYFSVSAYKAAIAAAPNSQAPKVIVHRVLQTEAGYPMSDWIDGETDAEPAFSNCVYQLAYDHPSPAESDNEAVRNAALEEAAKKLEAMKPGSTIDIVVQSFADTIRALKSQPAQHPVDAADRGVK